MALLTKASKTSPVAHKALEAALGYVFKDPLWMLRALTHRSFSADHNERLEFLGDSVLGLAISTSLFKRWADLPEGDLSRVRANLVRQSTLVQVAHTLQLENHLNLGSGETQSGGRQRPSILADALEALIGAIYLDGGFEAATGVVERLYGSHLAQVQPGGLDKDPKTALQEWLQGRKMSLPVYEVAETAGLAHEQTFRVLCSVHELKIQTHGEGMSRRDAEQHAAQEMLKSLPQIPLPRKK